MTLALDMRRLAAAGSVTDTRQRRDLLADARREEAPNARLVIRAIIIAIGLSEVVLMVLLNESRLKWLLG